MVRLGETEAVIRTAFFFFCKVICLYYLKRENDKFEFVKVQSNFIDDKWFYNERKAWYNCGTKYVNQRSLI